MHRTPGLQWLGTAFRHRVLDPATTLVLLRTIQLRVVRVGLSSLLEEAPGARSYGRRSGRLCCRRCSMVSMSNRPCVRTRGAAPERKDTGSGPFDQVIDDIPAHLGEAIQRDAHAPPPPPRRSSTPTGCSACTPETSSQALRERTVKPPGLRARKIAGRAHPPVPHASIKIASSA